MQGFEVNFFTPCLSGRDLSCVAMMAMAIQELCQLIASLRAREDLVPQVRTRCPG